jgi:predicted double-glycine peptidase
MNPWMDLLVSGLAMGIGLAVGWWSGRWRAWVMVYAVALAVTLAIGSVTRWPQTSEFWFLGWAGDVRLKSWLGAFVVPALLLAPTHRLARAPRFRILAGAAFMAVLIGLGPLASAAMVSGQLLAMRTRVGRDGICRQQTDFTCGPAAAVTALRRFGVTADEGEMAMAAVTTPFTGTSPEAMGRMLRRGFSDRGIEVDVRHFEGIDDLDPAGVTLVVVRYGFMLDHWVCVLGVSAKGVEVGDPNIGREIWSREDFEQRWRKVGVTLERRGAIASVR